MKLTVTLGIAYYSRGEKERALEQVALLERKVSKGSSEALYRVACVYAVFGNKDKALERLEQAHRLRDERMVWVKVDPAFDNLRTEPRYQEILRKMNLGD